jgi:hypothetical protein
MTKLEVSTTEGIQSSDDGDPLPPVAVNGRSGPLPVELAAFSAKVDGRTVQLTWRTVSETNNSGFAMERRVGTGSFVQIAFVEGQGTTTTPHTYRFADENLPFEATRATYRLKQIDYDGSFEYSNQVEVMLDVPSAAVLHGNFPNPFRQRTTIRYEVPTATDVHLAVYDLLGRRVATLVDERQSAGRKEATFDASRLSSGTYFVRLRAGGFLLTNSIVVLR